MTRIDERVAATYTLLRSLFDWAPGPRTATGSMVARSSLPGELPTLRIECPSCRGAGVRDTRTGREPCDRCRNGRIVVDAYTGRERDAPAGAVSRQEEFFRRLDVKRRRDAEIDRMARAFAIREGRLPEEDGGPLEHAVEARDRQYAAGDYEALERALAALRHFRPLAYEALMRFVVYGEETKVGPRLRERLDEVVAAVAACMPVEIRVPAWLHDEATARAAKGSLQYGRRPSHEEARAHRNAEIVRMRTDPEAPVPVDVVCRLFALSRSQVYAVVAAESSALTAQASGPAA